MNHPCHFTVEGCKLVGTLHRPAGGRPPVVIGAHGLSGTRESAKQIALAEACTDAGMAFLRFDHRGCGDSDPANAHGDLFHQRVADLLAAVSWVTARQDLGNRFGLFGSSLGGAACLAAAPAANPGAVVTWAAPVSSGGVTVSRQEAGRLSSLNARPFDVSSHLGAVGRVLICHGDGDAVVPVAHARAIYSLVDTPRRLIVFPDAGHRMSHPRHHPQFLSEAVHWFTRFLSPTPAMA